MMMSRILVTLTLLVIRVASSLDTRAPIVISGAGPAALVFCHRFLKLNNDTPIVVYERREKPQRYVDTKDLCVAGDYAFGFGISQKAQTVLRKTPGLLEAVEAISQPTAFAPGIELRIVNRRELCAEMIYELEKEYENDERLQMNFGQAVTDVDLENQQVVVMDTTTNTTKQVPYSLLIAADGANSVVRSKLIQEGELECERYYSDSTWKALQLPEQPLLSATTFQRYPKPFYKPHSFVKKDNGAILPRFQDRFVMLNFRGAPPDGDYSLPQNPFDATTPQELKDAIQKVNPNVTNFPDDAVLNEFLQQKAGRESWMKLNRHYVPEANIVLVGDAAVNTYSLFGQGMASAIMQADLLAETLANVTNSEEELQSSLLQYSNSSVVEGHAIADLNLLTHVLRKKFLPLKLWSGLQMMSIGKTLSQKPEVPYSDILKKKKRAIWFSRQFWKRVRIPAPTTKTK